MVFYHTSGNVKMLRNIIADYEMTKEESPYEYMKVYIEKWPDTTDDAKLSWIAETFLGIQKHNLFLKDIATNLSEELTKEDQKYFVIIFHAVIFQIAPKNMQILYKCLFNLSKPLLNTFTTFLGNNEILTFITQVAQSNYDTHYITEKIIGPLFMWQPYISEMGHSYAEHVKKISNRRVKPPTVPIHPNVLNRKIDDASSSSPHISLPVTPPNSFNNKSKKMLTKYTIDQKLKHIHEKNRQRATNLLNNVKSKNFHFAQIKSDKYYKRLSDIRDEIKNEFAKPLTNAKQQFATVAKNTALPVKDTTATLKRMNKRIQMVEQQELQWLHNLLKCCKNTTKVEELEEYDRQERERERLLDIERKHLMGQITYEEAVLAKKKLQVDNKKKYEEFLKEKETWNAEIENWKKKEMEKNRKQVEKLSLIELNLLQARNDVLSKKKETVDKVKKESEMMLAKALKEKHEELERRIYIIKEIKILAMIAKKSKTSRILDLTETSGLGVLCEMSMAELQERLVAMKIGLKEELEKKRKVIKDENAAAKQELEEAKVSIKNYMSERALMRKVNKTSNLHPRCSPSKEINELKKILEEKRRLRIKLSN